MGGSGLGASGLPEFDLERTLILAGAVQHAQSAHATNPGATRIKLKSNRP